MIRFDNVIFNPKDVKLATLEHKSVKGNPATLVIQLTIHVDGGAVMHAYAVGENDEKTTLMFNDLDKILSRASLKIK